MSGRSATLDHELIWRKGFYEFAKRAWHVVETQPYVDNWHIEEKCNHCEAVALGMIKDLVINEPPGCSKSLIVSVLFPAWVWTFKPGHRFIYASFDGSLALKHATSHFDLITSPWYIERWGNLLDPKQSKFAMGEFDNHAGGFRFSTSVGGKGTGRHCHTRVVDDPVKPADIEGSTKNISAQLSKTNRWWQNTMSSRRVDPMNFSSIVVMQRLHEADLSAECVSEGYQHLCFPMRFEPERAAKTIIGGDRRTYAGELLNIPRFPEEAVAKQEKDMGGADGPIASAQLQQRPAPPGGLLFKEETFQWFTLVEMPFEESFLCIVVDCAFKDSESGSGVGIEVWGMSGGKMYCYDSVLETLGFSQTIEAIQAVLVRFPSINAILIEEKANGSACIQILKEKFPNVIPMNPKTSKLARAHAANVYYQARSVYHLAEATWLSRKESNLSLFPKGRRNDDVDCTSMALIWLADHSMVDFAAAMSAMRNEQSDGTWESALHKHFGM